MIYPYMFIYDFEVFKYDWFVVFKEKGTGNYLKIHNDCEAVQNFFSTFPMLAGFNVKHYDQFILKAVLLGMTNEEIKAVNDIIIFKGIEGWNIQELKEFKGKINQYDLMDDCQQGLSLKAIEAHLGMDIRETTVPFDIDRPLTPEECEEVFFYCTHDVDATDKLDDLRKDYLENKIKLGEEAGIPPERALNMTNAKLTAEFLQAVPPHIPWTDEREYQYPTTLLKEYIPKEVFDFFDRMKDSSIPSEDLFKESLSIMVGDCPCKIAYGGIHGALPNYFETTTENRSIRNKDVASYYPNQMRINGYCSRNMPSPDIYANTIERRVAAKKSGDKATANALKLVLNTTYGAMLNRYNNLYDPLHGRSVCISGQLQLLELAEHCLQECPTMKVVQLNTDGIMVSMDNSDEPKWQEITEEWQKRTGFELEEDFIKAIYQKDVNNYVEIPIEGKPKIKGGYLVRGVAAAGAFNVNNNAVCVAEAIKEYFVNGTDPEEYINGIDDTFKFQMVAKAGAKYKEAYWLVNNEKVPVQKVNRVYAAKDPIYGKLFKVKSENDSQAKIDSLPEHCIIDNDNKVCIKDIDKSFYIELARKRINDFKGIKPEKKGKSMATAKETPAKMNVYQKLILARLKFLDEGIQKSGKNMAMQFKYFELDDIVPKATRIFNEIGLIAVPNFADEIATMTIHNCDDGNETITFELPFTQIEPIVSNSGKQVTNPLQALGSSVTYLRRYLWMLALDVCEPDEIDANNAIPNGQTQIASFAASPAVTSSVATAPVKPKTEAERKSTTVKLTNADGNASELQLKQLTNALTDLLKSNPDKKAMVQELQIKTKNFTEVSKKECEALILKIGEMMNVQEKIDLEDNPFD